MERSVRYIFRHGAKKPALCFRGQTKAFCLFNDETAIRSVEISTRDHDTSPYVQRNGGDYPPKLFASHMREISSSKAITQRALALLALPDTTAEIPELPPDEPAETASPLRVIEDQERASSPPASNVVSLLGRNGSAGVQRSKNPSGPRLSSDPVPEVAKRGAGTARPAAVLPLRPPKRPDRTAARTVAAPPAPARVAKAVIAPQQNRGTIIAKLAAELALTGQQLRVKLRAAGLRAPYDDEDKLRKLIKSWK